MSKEMLQVVKELAKNYDLKLEPVTVVYAYSKKN